MSLTIEPGQKVGIVGRTGAGKSTLIALLQKFYPAPANSIFLDNQPIEKLNPDEVRRWLGIVQQDPVLFRGTIGENLSLGADHLGKVELEKALREIGIWEDLQKTGKNLDFFVEERGANLSLGERQLLCLARVLVFNPPFLVLDEATANIDSDTERLLQKAIEKVTHNRTSLIIAHRTSTLKHCDFLIEIKNGQAQKLS